MPSAKPPIVPVYEDDLQYDDEGLGVEYPDVEGYETISIKQSTYATLVLTYLSTGNTDATRVPMAELVDRAVTCMSEEVDEQNGVMIECVRKSGSKMVSMQHLLSRVRSIGDGDPIALNLLAWGERSKERFRDFIRVTIEETKLHIASTRQALKKAKEERKPILSDRKGKKKLTASESSDPSSEPGAGPAAGPSASKRSKKASKSSAK